MKSFGIDDARKKVMTMESKHKNNATTSLLSKKRVKKRSENATQMDRSKQPRRTSSRVRGEKAPDVFVPDERNLWEPTYNEEIYTQSASIELGRSKIGVATLRLRVRPTRSTVVRQQQRRVLSPVQAENAGNAHDVQEVQHDAREVLRRLYFYEIR